MPEAEDVLLEAAERATSAVRALWRRSAAPGDTAPGRRRLALWLVACFGREWPVLPEDAPLAPGGLTRWLRRPPPWALRPPAVAWTDGEALHLPRAGLEAPDGPEGERTLLAALSLAARSACAASPARFGDPLARDVLDAAAAHRAEALLLRTLPGLAAALERARRTALRTRPSASALRPAEAAVEAAVVRLLRAPPGGLPQGLRALAEGEGAARGCAEDLLRRVPPAERARYRGVAPVAHWGWVEPARPGAPGAPGASASARGLPQRRLDRAVRRRHRDPEESDGRMGPFVLPFADPHLTVAEAAGLSRPPDRGPEEDLDALAEEVARQRELDVVRDGGEVREVLEGEGAAAAGEPGRAGGHGEVLLYPEWDARSGRYRRPGCAVRERVLPEGDPAWAEDALRARGLVLERLRRRFQPPRPRRVRLRRQIDGEQLDTAAWIDEWAERRAGGSPAGRVYAADRPRRRDAAVALLVDASASTDGWASGSERVIDVAKLAALCFCEAFEVAGERHALYAFSARGAADVRVGVAKRLAEPYGPAVRRRVGALQPDGTTRLGGALRHVTAELARDPARVRLLLLLSDGRPHDEDVYAGEYGLEDVRQAVREARAQRVGVFCVTIDRRGGPHLPRLFGPEGYARVLDVERLPEQLPRIARQLTRGRG